MEGVDDTRINERIRQIRNRFYEGKNAVMSEGTGLARTTLNNILGKSLSIPGYETLLKLVSLESPRINSEWLLKGEGEMLLSDAPDCGKSLPIKPHLEDVSAMAGYSVGGTAQSVLWENATYKPIISGMPDYDMTIRVNGDSMHPYLCSGDLIAIREIDMFKFKPGEIYVVSTDEDAFVKRVFRSNMDGMVIRCESINPSFPPFDLAADSILKMYRVVGLQRLI